MQHGRFVVREPDPRVDVRYVSDDGTVAVEVRGAEAEGLPAGSVFESVDEASEFFRRDTVGWSPSTRTECCEAVELRAMSWNVTPLAVELVRSSWFDDHSRFPAGSIEFDSTLLMRRIRAEWVPSRRTDAALLIAAEQR